MITKTIELLQTNQFYGISENIEIAKGKYQLPTSFNGVLNKIKRELKMKLNGK
jgi:hypothetical protein